MKNLQEDTLVAKTRITWRRFSWEILFKFHLGSKFERASPLTAVWDNMFVSLEVFLKQGSCGVLLLGVTNMTAMNYENLALEKSISGCCSINLKKRMKEMRGWKAEWINEWMNAEGGRMESKSQFTDKPNCGKKLIVEKKRAEKYGEKGFKKKQRKTKKNKTKSENKWKKSVFSKVWTKINQQWVNKNDYEFLTLSCKISNYISSLDKLRALGTNVKNKYCLNKKK